MTALVVFDVEAIPDLQVGRRLFAKPDSTADAQIRMMLGERHARNGGLALMVVMELLFYTAEGKIMGGLSG